MRTQVCVCVMKFDILLIVHKRMHACAGVLPPLPKLWSTRAPSKSWRRITHRATPPPLCQPAPIPPPPLYQSPPIPPPPLCPRSASEDKRLPFIKECLASTVERLKEAEKEVEQMQDSECANGCYPAGPCSLLLRLDLRRANYVSLTACGYVYVPQWSCNDCHEAMKPDFIDLGLFPGTMTACWQGGFSSFSTHLYIFCTWTQALQLIHKLCMH